MIAAIVLFFAGFNLILPPDFSSSAFASTGGLPPIADPATQPTTVPTNETISEDAVAPMYRAELGDSFDPGRLRDLYAAHLLIENYFAAKSSADRHAIAQRIEATKIPANILGRVTRIRLHWPALAPGVYYVNEQFGLQRVRYFLGLPPTYDRATAFPLLIKLPTAHAFLTNPLPDGSDVARIYTAWINDELSRHPDAMVLMPLLNLDELYGPSYEGMNSVIQAMQHAAGRVNVDPARVYMVGHSMAAHAVWNLALHYPTYFAAINPLAGAASADWQRLRLVNLLNVLPVVWADSTDDVIPVDQSRQIVFALRKQKVDVDYEESTNLGHAPTDDIVEREYQKMRARVRDLYPKKIWLQSNRPDTMFNRNDWLQVYQETTPGPERRYFFRHGAGSMIVYQNAYRVDAEIDSPNHIRARDDNAESMRFYLNDQMVDLTKPVVVTINNRPRFNAMVQTDIEGMLKDEVFLGRGWRYFTGHVDIDFGEDADTSVGSTTRPGGSSAGAPTTRPHRGTIELVQPNGDVKVVNPHQLNEE